MPLKQNHYARLLITVGCLLVLSACRAEGGMLQKKTKQVPANERVEQVLHDSEAPEIIETGSLLPTERLMGNGTLDIGKQDAPLTLLVFTEHHCNYCEEFNSEHLVRLTSDFVQSGKLRIELTGFPLQKYPQSENAAKAVLCAAQQNNGLAMNNMLFGRIYKDPASSKNYAKELEMDTDIFEECMGKEETSNVLLRQKEWANSLGVQYVPTFFLNGKKLVGLPYYADLRGQIEEDLRNLN